MKIIDRSRDVIVRFRWAYRKFSPGVVPKWPSNRGLTCSARSGSGGEGGVGGRGAAGGGAGCRAGGSGRQKGTWLPSSTDRGSRGRSAIHVRRSPAPLQH